LQLNIRALVLLAAATRKHVGRRLDSGRKPQGISLTLFTQAFFPFSGTQFLVAQILQDGRFHVATHNFLTQGRH
jgi:hypothetical protein